MAASAARSGTAIVSRIGFMSPQAQCQPPKLDHHRPKQSRQALHRHLALHRHHLALHRHHLALLVEMAGKFQQLLLGSRKSAL
jgi:hypothetical protein